MKSGTKRISILLMVFLAIGVMFITNAVSQILSTKAQWNQGNLSYYDNNFGSNTTVWKTCPLLAILNDPNLGTVFEDDFYNFEIHRTVGPLDSIQRGWVYTSIDQGSGDDTVVFKDWTGGVVRIALPAGDDDGVEVQWHDETFNLASGKPVWFEAKVSISDNLESDLHCGLAVRDTDIIGGVADASYFLKSDGDSALSFVHVAGSVADTTDVGFDLADNTFYRLGFAWDGYSYINLYVDGVYKARVTVGASDIPSAMRTISFGIKNGTTTADSLHMDYIKAVQLR